MKHVTTYYLLPTILMLCITACSTQKNTGASRTWHELKVIHNVQLNGEKAFREGMDAINQAHTDNFSTFLPLYPVSNPQAAQASASSMDKAIDKCRKSIKLHSIKARPKINTKKYHQPEYKNWLQNKEFNAQMYRAWLMLGQSEFHKGDFLGSIGTFRYIEKLYENDPNMVALCQLWVARAYGELGWLYEAEDLIQKVQVDNLSRKNASFFSTVYADILLKEQRYKEAIPYLKVAKQEEKRKGYLPRFEYVLAQCYQTAHLHSDAQTAYQRVYQLHPRDVNMEFNARLHYAELKGDTTQSMKQLRNMAKLYKYRDQLDQLYGTMGNIYLMNGDTARALAYYQTGIDASTQNGNEKGEVLLRAGDLYYDRQDYAEASPCYHEATTILPATHQAYPRVAHRSEVLDEVVVHIQTIELQDSLQRLGRLSPAEQLQVVEQLIANLKEKERQDSIAQAEQSRENELETRRGGSEPPSVDLSRMVGNRSGNAANWYFYNPQLMRTGKQEFMRQWGNRALEDNWRRMSKASLTAPSSTTTPADTLSLATSDTLSSPQTNAQSLPERYDPQYYLMQIPQSANDYAASDALISDAMYNLVYLYRDRVENIPLSNQMFADFLARFPNDERIIDLYYDLYLYCLRVQHLDEAARCRQEILTRFPETAQAKIVGNPDYFHALQRMAIEQDSLYEATYQAYRHNDFATIQRNTTYAEQTYPLTPLMPRLLFLNAVATAKTDGQDAFILTLKDMVQRYPDNPLSAMAKDMLAMMGAGLEAQQGTSTSTLLDQRQAETAQEETETDSAQEFSTNRGEQSLVYLVVKEDEQVLNQLQYEVALFNFTQFLIKDYDLRKVPIFSFGLSAVEVAGFVNMEEAEWYISLLQSNADIQTILTQLNAQIVPITETNLKLLNHPYTLDEYLHHSTR